MTVQQASASAVSSAPFMRRSMPMATLRLTQFSVAAALCLLVLESRFWMVAGLLISVANLLAPIQVGAWWVLLLLALGQLWRVPSAFDPTFHLLLAGVHLLHVLGSIGRWLPWRGRMELAALAAPLARFAAIQVIAQVVAVFALYPSSGDRSTVPGLSIASAVMLAILALIFVRAIRRASMHDEHSS